MSKKKKVIHVDKLIVKADEVIILNDDHRRDREKDRDRDPWFGFLRGDRRDFDDNVLGVSDEFKDDKFKDDDLVEDVEDKKEDAEDIADDRRRPRWF
ncbi:hypothetical protein [Bacillus sp. AK128]